MFHFKAKKKRFSVSRTKTNSNFTVNLVEIEKEATVHFCILDEAHFLRICTLQYLTMECIEHN